MSGFDTSQPITGETALKDVDDIDESSKPGASANVAESAESGKLGDATPGPR